MISIALCFVSCGNEQKSGQQNAGLEQEGVVILTDDQYKNAGIETGKLTRQNIASVLKVNGRIDVPPQSMVSISVPLGGYLKSTRLLPGMHINKGEKLAVMEDVQYIQLQQDYLTAKAQFLLNESEYNRQKELNQSKAASDKVFELARADYQTQLILIKSLEQKLKLIGVPPQSVTPDNIANSINIYSPITGFVSAVNVNIGKYVNSSDVLFELVDPADIHLTLTVFEKDVNKLSIGQKLVAYTNTNPEKKYKCEIILISRNLSGNNAAEAHCHIEHFDKTLLPGMFMNADIEISGNDAMTLPEDAIVLYKNKHYVFIVKGNNQFEIQEVKSGASENGFTEVTVSDQLIEKSFVTKGAYNLLMTLKNTSEE